MKSILNWCTDLCTFSFITYGIGYMTQGAWDLSWPIKVDWTCKILYTLYMESEQLSAFTLVLFSVERLIVVYFPLHAKTWLSFRRTWLTTAVVLTLVALSLAHLPFSIRSIRFTLNTYCAVKESITPPVLSALYWIAMGVQSYTIPTAITITLNVLIYRRIRTADEHRKHITVRHTMNSQAASNSTGCATKTITITTETATISPVTNNNSTGVRKSNSITMLRCKTDGITKTNSREFLLGDRTSRENSNLLHKSNSSNLLRSNTNEFQMRTPTSTFQRSNTNCMLRSAISNHHMARCNTNDIGRRNSGSLNNFERTRRNTAEALISRQQTPELQVPPPQQQQERLCKHFKESTRERRATQTLVTIAITHTVLYLPTIVASGYLALHYIDLVPLPEFLDADTLMEISWIQLHMLNVAKVHITL